MGVNGSVSATFSLLLSLFLFSCLCPHLIRADGTVGIVCYGFNGASYVNNTKCPGSNACCGYQATCVSNRLCHNPGDAEGTYVRGPCANNVWDSTCAQVCYIPIDETQALSGFLPRVSQCGDGSWCCANDATCCSNGRGIFLDSDGNSATAEGTKTVSYPPVSGTGLERYTDSTIMTTLPTTSATSTTLISTTPSSTIPQVTSTTSSILMATGTSAAPSSSQDEDKDSDTKIGLGVGLGVPLAAIVAGGSVWFLLRRKRKPNGSHITGSDGALRNGPHSRGSGDGIIPGSHLALSGDGHAYGSDAASVMLVMSPSKSELSGEGKSIHELQSLALSPGYQHPQYPNSRSSDLRPHTHVSYELP